MFQEWDMGEEEELWNAQVKWILSKCVCSIFLSSDFCLKWILTKFVCSIFMLVLSGFCLNLYVCSIFYNVFVYLWWINILVYIYLFILEGLLSYSWIEKKCTHICRFQLRLRLIMLTQTLSHLFHSLFHSL